MSESRIADTRPAPLVLEPGIYWWCACGRSSNQPWCDGSHAGSDFRPQRVEITEKAKVWLCQCKRSGRGHLCDGAHKTLHETR